jgi:hypothetical protein
LHMPLFPFRSTTGRDESSQTKSLSLFFYFFVLFSDMGTSRWKFLAIGYPKAVSSVSQMFFQSVVYIRLYVSKLYYFSFSLSIFPMPYNVMSRLFHSKNRNNPQNKKREKCSGGRETNQPLEQLGLTIKETYGINCLVHI